MPDDIQPRRRWSPGLFGYFAAYLSFVVGMASECTAAEVATPTSQLVDIAWTTKGNPVVRRDSESVRTSSLRLQRMGEFGTATVHRWLVDARDAAQRAKALDMARSTILTDAVIDECLDTDIFAPGKDDLFLPVSFCCHEHYDQFARRCARLLKERHPKAVDRLSTFLSLASDPHRGSTELTSAIHQAMVDSRFRPSSMCFMHLDSSPAAESIVLSVLQDRTDPGWRKAIARLHSWHGIRSASPRIDAFLVDAANGNDIEVSTSAIVSLGYTGNGSFQVLRRVRQLVNRQQVDDIFDTYLMSLFDTRLLLEIALNDRGFRTRVVNYIFALCECSTVDSSYVRLAEMILMVESGVTWQSRVELILRIDPLLVKHRASLLSELSKNGDKAAVAALWYATRNGVDVPALTEVASKLRSSAVSESRESALLYLSTCLGDEEAARQYCREFSDRVYDAIGIWMDSGANFRLPFVDFDSSFVANRDRLEWLLRRADGELIEEWLRRQQIDTDLARLLRYRVSKRTLDDLQSGHVIAGLFSPKEAHRKAAGELVMSSSGQRRAEAMIALGRARIAEQLVGVRDSLQRNLCVCWVCRCGPLYAKAIAF